MDTITSLKFSDQKKASKITSRKSLTLRESAKIKDKEAVTFQSTLQNNAIQIEKKIKNDLFYKIKMSIRLNEIQANKDRITQDSSTCSSDRSHDDSGKIKTIREYRQRQKMNDQALLIKYRDLVTQSIFNKLI